MGLKLLEVILGTCAHCGAEVDIEREITGEMCDGEPYLAPSYSVVGAWYCCSCGAERCTECAGEDGLCDTCAAKEAANGRDYEG